MKWSDVPKIIGTGAPLIGKALLGPLGETVGNMIAGVLGVKATPGEVFDALKNDPQAFVKLKELEAKKEIELLRIVETSEAAQQEQINKTMRVEAQSKDKFVSRWRPTFGYCMAGTWVLIICMLFFVFIFTALTDIKLLAQVISACTGAIVNLAALFAVPMAVLGVSIKKRSDDKKLAAGRIAEPGVITKLLTGFKK